MSLTVAKNTNISRVISVSDSNGPKQHVASLTGQVVPDKAMSFSLVINNTDLALANQADLTAAFDAFVAELRLLAQENNLPV